MLVYTFEILFWSSTIMLFYIFAGYPLILLIFSKIYVKTVKKANIEPTVAFIVAAYNEEKVIEKKIKNTLNLDYPKNKLSIIIASDGSTDNTERIVEKYNNRKIILHRGIGRQGKTAIRNEVVKNCKEDIIIFSDAPTIYQKDAIRKLVRNFADPEVGHVSGIYDYFSNNKSVGIFTKYFWFYENIIKVAQSKLKTMTSASGCISAFRRKHYVPLPPNIIEDLAEPLMFVKKGFRVIIDVEAKAWENTTNNIDNEINMRTRVIRGGMRAIFYMRELLNPFKYGFVFFQLLSHKILRWCSFVFFLMMGISGFVNMILFNSFYYYMSTLSFGIFLLFGFIGYTLEKKSKYIKFFNFFLYLLMMNYISAKALFIELFNEISPEWETFR